MAGVERRRIRVLTLVTRLNVGGPARLLRTFRRHHDSEDFDWRLACGVIDEGESEPSFAGEIVDVRIPSLRRSIAPLDDARALAATRRLIRDLRPDIVHTHTAKAGWIGRVAAHGEGVPTVHTYHGNTFAGYWGPLRGRLFRGLERHAARRSTRIVAQSRAEAADLARHLGAAAADRITVITPGLDLDTDDLALESVSALRADLGLGDELVLAFVGRLTAIKNCAGFLRVVRRIHARGIRVGAVIAGAGTPRHEHRLHDLVDELDLRDAVRWLGMRADVGRVYGLADALVLTSRNEGTPLVLAEALACHTPVAAYDVGGVGEVVRDCRGAAVVAPDDEESLAGEILRLARMREEEPEAAAADAATVRARFDPLRWVRDVEELYRELARS